MAMDLTGIINQNEYYTNHYFLSIFEDNAGDTISAWKSEAKENDEATPWAKFRDTSKQYYRIRDKYLHLKNEEQSKSLIQEMATLYLQALGYDKNSSVMAEVADNILVPVFHEETKSNGAPLLWVLLSVANERDDDILQGKIFPKSDNEDSTNDSLEIINDDIIAKLFFAGEEAPRWIILIGINQIALIDRNKWNEKRFLLFDLNDIFSRHEETTFQALSVLLHHDSLCPCEGVSILDTLDANSHKHSAGVSDALKYALRESIELLGNEVIYDMKNRQGIDIELNPIDSSELTVQCLRYMYRILFMLFIEARPELGYAPMKSQVYLQGYSLEGLRDISEKVREESEGVSEGYYIDYTISELFKLVYEGYPGDITAYKKAIEMDSMHDVFTVEALKAHIFDPEYTSLITKARLRNSTMIRIIDLMSISRPGTTKERRGRISYSALGINQMGAVYEALLSYRGFLADETLFEVKRAGDKFNELDVGYFVPERELDYYTEEERVRYEKGEKKGQLRKYEKGTFIYRLAGREREKSASYYTPEVLTKCLVKYALKELLKGKTADEILHLTICEPAMGSAAFLNEAINQLAEAYLYKKQEELGETITFDKRFEELQKVKMYIADRNVYGVDLNPIAVELAEVSLWLNTIYKGAYVPWFRTQIVCGNSLIGARRQVYYTSKLEKGKWYDEAPDRILPGEKRKRKGVNGRVYHFLLGDPGMADYRDTVIKKLEPENLKIIKEWNKKFTDKYLEEDITTLLTLSESIDQLWDDAIELRKCVVEATEDSFCIYGHEEIIKQRTTIREKDNIYHRIFKSEHMNNAGPYARLKAVMDYWCALWFWPLDKATLLPTRQEFFFDINLLLDGTINTVQTTSSIGQIEMVTDEKGNMQFVTRGNLLELEAKHLYAGRGEVDLEALRSGEDDRSKRLKIVNEISEQQRFLHWELEFGDVFLDNGGFDLVIGNPPWIKYRWDETNILSDLEPRFIIKDYSANIIEGLKQSVLQNEAKKIMYINEYNSCAGILNFMNSLQNYEVLKGVQTNLYKCFLPSAWYIGINKGISAFIHPDGVFDDPNGGKLREEIYKRIRYHFHFINEKLLFAEVGHPEVFSLNVYCNKLQDKLLVISNLFAPSTIDECFDGISEGEVGGIKDLSGDWNIRGHQDRIISVGEEERKMFGVLYDNVKDGKKSRLPAVHCKQLLDVLDKLSKQKVLCDLQEEYITTECFHETGAQNANIIKENVSFTEGPFGFVYSGPHIGVGNPIYQTPRREVKSKGDFDKINLEYISDYYLQRSKYIVACNSETYISSTPKTPWNTNYVDEYKLISRKMLNLKQERTLISAIAPKGTTHINGILGMAFKDYSKLVLMAALMASLPYDYFIKSMGKSNLYDNNAGQLPYVEGKFNEYITLRIALLNCLSINYGDLWNNIFTGRMQTDLWGKNDYRLTNCVFKSLQNKWTHDTPLRNDYARREALVEIDVLVSMALGISLEELKIMYRMQFPVLQSYELDTWYDKNGRIVFTNNRSLTGVGFSRKEWEEIKEAKEGVFRQTIIDDTMPYGPVERIVEYVAPFDRCDREKDYEEVWHNFEARFKDK